MKSNPRVPDVATLRRSSDRAPADASKRKNDCRIFISRKTSDSHILGAESDDRRTLIAFAAGRLTFSDASQIKPGENWRQTLCDEIEQADILLLLLTRPARKQFHWPLYEAGLFNSLRGGRRLICIYSPDEPPPDQVSEIHGVEATVDSVLNLFDKLYSDKDFTNTRTALNPEAFTMFNGQLSEIASNICRHINGKRPEDRETVHYTNPYVQLLLQPDDKRLSDKTPIGSDERSLKRVFGLALKSPSSQDRTWGDIKSALSLGERDPCDFNLRWTREVEQWVAATASGLMGKRQITSRFAGRDRVLWGPEIEIWRAYDSGRRVIDITFSPEVHDAWLQESTAPVALAANLGLASRIRHELLETYLRRVHTWRDGDVRFADLAEVVEAIEHDGFFIRWLTEDQYCEAFEDPELVSRLQALETDFGTNIRPLMHDALENRSVTDVRTALDLWHANNAEFLSIGIPRYQDLLCL